MRAPPHAQPYTGAAGAVRQSGTRRCRLYEPGQPAVPGPGTAHPYLTPFHVIAEDGYRLPLRHWSADGDPRAVALAVHGFNDHGGSFKVLAKALAPHGIRVYAHDQRGFGTTAQRRLWPGHERLVQDVELLVELLQERYPDTPLYLIGKSMGAAVVILTMTGDTPPSVAGSVLIAPATWDRPPCPGTSGLACGWGYGCSPRYRSRFRRHVNWASSPPTIPRSARCWPRTR